MLIKRSKLEIGKNFGLFWIIFQFIFTNDTKNLLLLPIFRSWNILSKQLIQRQYQIASKLFHFLFQGSTDWLLRNLFSDINMSSWSNWKNTNIILRRRLNIFSTVGWRLYAQQHYPLNKLIHTCTFKLHLRSVLFRTVSSTRLVFIIDLSYFCDLIGSDAWWR